MNPSKHVFIVLTVIVMFAAWLPAVDVLKKTGLTQAQASAEMLNSLVQGTLPVHLGIAAFQKGSPAERVDLVQSAIAWAKTHARSPEFVKTYRQWREQNRPVLEQKPPVDEQMRKQKEETDQQLAEMKKNMEKVPPEMRKQMEQALKEVAAQRKQMEGDQSMQAMVRKGMETERQQDQVDFQKRLGEFETNFPADLKPLIARRLKEFLNLTATIDFAAKLLDRGEFKVFADQTLENKENTWKYCFRAGPDVVAAARASASAWLAELGNPSK